MDTSLVSSWPTQWSRRVCEIMEPGPLHPSCPHINRRRSCSITKYLLALVWVPSITLHFSSPLPPPSPNRRNLNHRSRRSEAQPTHRRRQLHPPRWVCRPTRLPPGESPASTSLLSAYTPSSLSISPSRYGQLNDHGSKHHHLAVRDPRDRGSQCGEDIVDSPRWYCQPPSLISHTWSCALFNSCKFY
jgi:hypothetical protein